MNITKEEALQKIKELQSYIEDLDKPKITEFGEGDVFYSDKRGYDQLTILPCGWNFSSGKRYSFGGNIGPCRIFSNGGESGLTKQQVLEHLNKYNYKKVGKLVIEFDK